MKIYGLMGKKKAGKDLFCTIAQTQILHHEIRRYAFADALKHFCIEYLGVPEESCFGTQEDKLKVIGTWGDYFSERFMATCFPESYEYNKQRTITGRVLLQLVGTEIFRHNFKGTIWVDIVLRKIKEAEEEFNACGREQIAIITDSRFKNEFDAVKSTGGKVIRLFRHTDDVKDQHASEKEMDLIPNEDFDYIITKENNVNQDDLTKEILRIFKEEKLL